MEEGRRRGEPAGFRAANMRGEAWRDVDTTVSLHAVQEMKDEWGGRE